ncbi:MAG: hypothetical protein LBK22_08615 [Tannerella sp.]|jgi:hypothetical protein|nr:hypothetical protein [Tannerella sp.]
MPDYIPRAINKFDAWQDNMMTVLTEKATSFGIRPEELSPLTTQQGKWRILYILTENVKNANPADILARNQMMGEYETSIRDFRKRFLVGNPRVTDSDLERMGFHVDKKTRTDVKAPTTTTILSIDVSHHLRHYVHFRDSELAGTAKPHGVIGCEIWRKVGGTPPAGVDEMTYVGMDTRSPYLCEYTGEQYGEIVYYMCRWINTRGEHGPWSEVARAVIA